MTAEYRKIRGNEIKPRAVGTENDPVESVDTDETTTTQVSKTFESEDAENQYFNPSQVLGNEGASSKTLYCSPNGDRDAEGTQSDPLTLAGALAKVPRIITGQWTIDLHTVPSNNGNLPAVYSGVGGTNRYMSAFRYSWGSTARFDITGDATTPGDVQIDHRFQTGFFGKFDHHRIEGVRFRGWVQTNGMSLFADCEFHEETGATRSISTKAGNFHLRNCTVGDSSDTSLNADVGINLSHGGKLAVWNSDIYADTHAIQTSQGGEVFVNGPGDLNGLGAFSNQDPEDIISQVNLDKSSLLIDGNDVPRLFKGDHYITLSGKPVDVRGNYYPETKGLEAYHDGSGTDNTEGPAFYDGSAWVSLVDGTTIS